MSEFSYHKAKRIKRLINFSLAIINKQNPSQAVKDNIDLMENSSPEDVISLVHELSKLDFGMEDLKIGINKLLNLFYKNLQQKDWPQLNKNSFFKVLMENNTVLDQKLKALRKPLKDINSELNYTALRRELQTKFSELLAYEAYYQLKENVIFPVLEEQWEDVGCLGVMWSIHDDIRKGIKRALVLLEEEDIDLKEFNQVTAKIFFNTYAIKFREEKILYPQILSTIPAEKIVQMESDAKEFSQPFVKIKHTNSNIELDDIKAVDLGSGLATAKQISLIFNHLPVDITYVDENNKVVYFSTPKKRFFPRTNSIIGRDVRNCHPKESVDIVEKIVLSFKNGEKDAASFWIKMKDMYILIQYFAVRDKKNIFRGTLEVTQDISDIQEINGEKRLLDWD